MNDFWELNVVLLVAVKREWEEVIKHCHKLCGSDSEKFDFRTYWVDQREIDSDSRLIGVDKKVLELLDKNNNLLIRLVIMKLPHPGSGGDAAAHLASKAIEVYRPHTICMVGMCAGNPSPKFKIKKGDVILNSSIVRHDYGGLILSEVKGPGSEPSKKFSFEHRVKVLNIDDSGVYKYTDFLNLLNAYNEEQVSPKFAVTMGVFSSGNQVTQVPDVFKYIEDNVLNKLGGDDEEWELKALEMEAFSVAYSADSSSEKIGWVIVKGVADFADGKKNKKYQRVAINNSLDFLFWFLPRVVNASFSRAQSERSSVLSELKEAKEYYQNGDFKHSAEKFNKVYEAGCRCIDARKHYIKCLMRYDYYNQAASILEAYLRRPWYDDAVTVELLAEIYWRQSDYDRMHELLEKPIQKETSQILYLRALCLIFRSADRSDIKEDDLSTAVALLQKAISCEIRQPKFFLNINLCFALKLQLKLNCIDEKNSLEVEFNKANDLISYELKKHSNRALLYIYKLLLLAIVDKDSEFAAFIDLNKASYLVIALDNVDMVYKRIEILYRDNNEKLNWYFGGLTNFIIRNQQIGKVVRKETEQFIHGL